MQEKTNREQYIDSKCKKVSIYCLLVQNRENLLTFIAKKRQYILTFSAKQSQYIDF